MQSSDIAVPDECLAVAADHSEVQQGKQPGSAVASAKTEDAAYIRICEGSVQISGSLCIGPSHITVMKMAAVHDDRY